MADEWIPVVSDAVKIGLGAAIGGGFSLLAIWLNSRRKLRESLVADRRQQLREITSDLTRIHNLFFQKSTTIASLATLRELRGKNIRLLRDTIEEEMAALEPELGAGLFKLHELEARLCLVGFESIAAVMENYRHALTDIWEIEETSSEQLCDVYLERIMAARLTTLRSLANAYASA